MVGGVGFLGANLAGVLEPGQCFVARRAGLDAKRMLLDVIRGAGHRVLVVNAYEELGGWPSGCGEDRTLAYLAGVLGGGEKLYWRVHVELPSLLVEKLEPERVVYVSAASVSPRGCEEEEHLSHLEGVELDAYTRSKAAGEEVLARLAEELGFVLRIVRPVLMAGMYWRHGEARLALLAERGLVIRAPVPVVDALDTARLIVESVSWPGRLLWFNSSAGYSLGELLLELCRVSRGRRCLQLPVPRVAFRLASIASVRARLAYRLASLWPEACVARRMGFGFSGLGEVARRVARWLSALAPRHG